MARIRIYPHNDLLNLAHYQRETINEKTQSGNHDAIQLDCLSCIISLAFAVEALINFVGQRKIGGWQERRPYREKVNDVCREAGLEFNASIEPYRTVWELKQTRDMIAHGQPFETSMNVQTREELRAAMACPWDQHLSPEYINHAYEQVKEFKNQLFSGSGISIGESLTSSVSGAL